MPKGIMIELTPADQRMKRIKEKRKILSTLTAYLIDKPLKVAEAGNLTTAEALLKFESADLVKLAQFAKILSEIAGEFYRGEAAQLSPAVAAQVKNADDLPPQIRNADDIEFEATSVSGGRVRALHSYAKKHGLTLPAVKPRRIPRKPYPANRYVSI
jgi:hypothetical protein